MTQTKNICMANPQTRFFFLLVLLLGGGALPAQESSRVADTVLIPDVVVSAVRLSWDRIGKHTQVLDSLAGLGLQTQSLTRVLETQTPVYVKNYGPGQLATSSLRGGSAQHTAVLWNGLNLQSPLLGQIDFSLLPVNFFDRIRLDYGGGSALWGSGAVGGAIHLNNEAAFDEPLQLNWDGLFGSFGAHTHHLNVRAGSERYAHSTKVFYQRADNDFRYTDFTGRERNLPHAQQEQTGVLQQHAWRINKRHQLDANIWYQQSDRNLPPTSVQDTSAARQDDRALRGMLNYQWRGDAFQLRARAAGLRERLNYEDPLADLISESAATTAIGEVEVLLPLNNQHQLHFGLHGARYWATSSSFTSRQEQQRTAGLVMYRFTGPDQRWRGLLSLRQEWVDGESVPFLPSLRLEWLPHPSWRVYGKTSRDFRLPTFNDLYWNPGGNPALRPERGWGQEVGIRWQKGVSGWRIEAGANAFTRRVEDWIIWLPGSNYWSPENVRNVWSRGIEQQLALNGALGPVSLRFDTRYHYTRTTNEAGGDQNTGIEGKQLIYVPRHQWLGNLQINYRDWQFSYHHRYTGEVFVLADNSEALPAFQVADLGIGRTFDFAGVRGRLTGRVNNLWDRDYVVVANRPVPGRHYSLTLQLNFNR